MSDPRHVEGVPRLRVLTVRPALRVGLDALADPPDLLHDLAVRLPGGVLDPRIAVEHQAMAGRPRADAEVGVPPAAKVGAEAHGLGHLPAYGEVGCCCVAVDGDVLLLPEVTFLVDE